MKGSRWQILRTHDGIQGHWTGEYNTAEEALEAVQNSLVEHNVVLSAFGK
jgi:hypothetical protein